jgi:hypothetical protein
VAEEMRIARRTLADGLAMLQIAVDLTLVRMCEAVEAQRRRSEAALASAHPPNDR